MAATPDGRGYWLVASDGGIFTFGDATFYGSTGGLQLNSPSWAWPPPPTAGATGWWPPTAASSPSATPPSTAPPAVSISTSPSWAWPPPPTAGATGWWPPTAASSPSATPPSTAPPAISLNKPIVGMAATPDGKGYWLVASDGGIFTFGDATFYGSASASDGQGNIVALASASNGQGYWAAGSNGDIDPFGAAPSEGSMSGRALNRPIVGFAAAPLGIPAVESPASLSITTTTLPNASVGVPYGATLVASGGTRPARGRAPPALFPPAWTSRRAAPSPAYPVRRGTPRSRSR